MLAKAVLLACAGALLVQTALSACAGSRVSSCGCGSGLASGYNAGVAGYGCGASGVASTGGGLIVSSISPIAPVGITVISENTYEGQLCAGGNLPFLGGVAIEGVLASDGLGAVSYGCGDGASIIGSEGPITTGITIPGAVFPPNTPSSTATADALALVGSGLAGAGYGLSGAGYGLGAGCGRAPVTRGCGCSGRY